MDKVAPNAPHSLSKPHYYFFRMDIHRSMKKQIWALFLILSVSSCACAPEEFAQFAYSSMENILGDGFMPSEELRALGKFQSTSVNLSNSTQDGVEESTIFLRLENGDPKILAEQREQLLMSLRTPYCTSIDPVAWYNSINTKWIRIHKMAREATPRTWQNHVLLSS